MVVPYRLWGFQYSRRYHKWGIGIGSSPIGCEGFVQPRKGQGEAKTKLVLQWFCQLFICIYIHNIHMQIQKHGYGVVNDRGNMLVASRPSGKKAWYLLYHSYPFMLFVLHISYGFDYSICSCVGACIWQIRHHPTCWISIWEDWNSTHSRYWG